MELLAGNGMRHGARLQAVGRHLGCVADGWQLVPPAAAAATAGDEWCAAAVDARLRALFGPDAQAEGPLAVGGGGRRYRGVDLRRPLSEAQVAFLLDSMAQFRILCLAGQNLESFSLAQFERFANHWGAVVPHPNNFTRGGKPAQGDGASDGAFELIPFEKRTAARVDQTPVPLTCLPHESPAVLVVSNLRGAAAGKDPSFISDPNGNPADEARNAHRFAVDRNVRAFVSGGGSWHTDIEYEPLPMYVSMFLVHGAPTRRDAATGTWVTNPPTGAYFGPAEPEGAPVSAWAEGYEELSRHRELLPLNGETAFADTAAALAALPLEEQEWLSTVRLRRRLNAGDLGWEVPLVVTNPRSGLRSLHSPIWASRPRVRPPAEVVGMSVEEGRGLLDKLEAHVLSPRFRYDHVHTPGDVTLWDNYMTLHNSPPSKGCTDDVGDARLLYRISCKGEPALSLPRRDEEVWLQEHIAFGYTTPPDILAA